MNKNLLEEVKRMNTLMGVKPILLEGGKQTYQLIDNTIGWKKVGEFFDDLFDGVGRKAGNNSADEIADIMRRESDENFRKSYNELRLKAKADLQSYADTISKKLQRGATNFTPDEKKLLVLLEKFAQTQQDAKTIKQEIPIIKQKVSKNLANQERYTMVSDEVYSKVVNELETKIANGEKVTENDLLNLYKAELDNLKKLDANGNPVGELLPPELKQAMINRLKTEKKYKDFVNGLSVNPDEVVQENVRREVNGKLEELNSDVSDLYNDIKDKNIDADLITENSNLKNLQNKLSTETDPLKKIDIQREIRLTESKIKVLEKEKELKNAVTDWVTGKSSTATDVRRVADELVNNREATDVLGDAEKRIFGDAYVGTQKTWSDYFIGFTDFLRGKKCSYTICKLYRGWWDLTGMSLIMDIIQNLSKVLDDILEVKKGNFLGLINYNKLRDPEFFQQQYKEIMNGMQEIAARKEKGWQQKLQLERDRLLRLIETRRPVTNDPEWLRLVNSNADLDDQANAALVDAGKKIKDAVREADGRYAPGLKGLTDWLETQGTDGLDFFETLETFLTKFKDAISTNQSWFREMTPFMKKSKGSYDKIKELNVGRSTLNGDPMEKPLKDATEKLKEKTGNVTEKAASISQIMSIIWNSIKKVADSKLVNWAINYARYGLFTKLDVFKQILMRHGYVKGLLMLYLKVVIGIGLVKAVGYLWDYIASAILDALVSVGQMEPATAQIILTWAIHPITSIKAYRGDKESILYLALETDRLREQKKVFWQGLFDKFFDPENLKVYPFIEEFLNMFRLLANTYNHFSGEELKDFEDDLSVIGGKTPQILQFILGGVFGFDYFIKKEDASIFDLEKGLQKKIEDYMKDVDTLRKSSLKDVMGDDFDNLVLTARQKKLDSISPYIRANCYNNNLLKLLKAKIDINPKFTKPFTEITLDKAKTVDENKKRSLTDKISSLSSTTMKVDDPNFNIQFSETVGLVIGQDFYRIELGPRLSDGTTIQPDTFAPNVFGGSKNSKCCTFMDAFIKKEGDTNWYCLASPKVMEMIGGNAGAEQMVTIQEDVDARAVFDKIIDGTKALENQKNILEQKWEDIDYWTKKYDFYLNEGGNKFFNKQKYKNTLLVCREKVKFTAEKIQKIKELTKEWQNYINGYLDKTKTIQTKAMERERNDFYSTLKTEFDLDLDNEGHVNINKWFDKYSDDELEKYVDIALKENRRLNKNIINERYLLGNRNMRSSYIFENEDEQRFGENKFDHWYDTFTFQKYDEKTGDFKDIETDSLKHGKIKERFNDFIKNYDGDDAFVRAVVDTHPEVSRFKYLKDQANIQEAYYPTGLASILSVIRESKGEYEIFSVSRQKGGNWNLVKGDFTQKEMSNMVLTKQIPPEKKPKEKENGLESLKKKEATGTNSLRNDEKEGLKNLPKKVKEKVQEKISRGWTTEIPPKVFKDFYEESEISSVFNEKIPIYKLEATPEFFRSLQKNSSHVLVRRGFCRSLLMTKNDSDINSEQRKVVNHILSKCEDKFEGKFGLRYLSKKS